MPGVVARRHARGASLALAAPCDQLFLATEVNEWALCATLLARDSERWSGLEAALAAQAMDDSGAADPVFAPALREFAAFERFTLLAAREARPDVTALIAQATELSLPYVLDDTTLTVGGGAGGVSFELSAPPSAADVPWSELRDIPTTLVTGSNGKTTSVRVLAACARAAGWPAAYCCTDGVFLDGELEVSGDYSGPAGTRRVMRERRAQAAILEAARGGILRRGLAVSRAHVALVTNVSPDHFGEYGIDDLGALADVKLSVAGVLTPGGLLVLNADDAELLAKARGLAERFGRAPRLGWFALDADQPVLTAHRAQGGVTCGVRAGRLILSYAGAEHDLGATALMPLTVEGSALYNVANLAGAALAAAALGIEPRTIAEALGRFGSEPADNPGRMMRFEVRGVTVLLDYAHNPEGLRGLLDVARHVLAGRGRLGLLLGQAGNRQDAEIEALARAAAQARPDLIVVKENEGYLRGRQPGEIPRLIRAALLGAGLSEAAVPVRMSEFEAARLALDWARPGDVLALPVHSASARAEVLALLRQE